MAVSSDGRASQAIREDVFVPTSKRWRKNLHRSISASSLFQSGEHTNCNSRVLPPLLGKAIGTNKLATQHLVEAAAYTDLHGGDGNINILRQQ